EQDDGRGDAFHAQSIADPPRAARVQPARDLPSGDPVVRLVTKMSQDSQSTPPPARSAALGSAGEPGGKLPATVEEHGRWTALRLQEASLMDPGVIEALGAHVDHLLEQGRVRLIIDFEQ